MMSSAAMPLLPPGAATSSVRKWKRKSRGGGGGRSSKVERPLRHAQYTFAGRQETKATVRRHRNAQKYQSQLLGDYGSALRKTMKFRGSVHSSLPTSCYNFLNEILSKIVKKDPQQFFAYPVDGTVVIDYYDVIEEPMSFETMREKLSRKEYSDFESFERDIRLIVDNCCRYNARNTVFYKAARLVDEYWNKMRQKAYARFITLADSYLEEANHQVEYTSDITQEAEVNQTANNRRNKGVVSRGSVRGGLRIHKTPVIQETSVPHMNTGGDVSGMQTMQSTVQGTTFASSPSDAADGIRSFHSNENEVATQRIPPTTGPSLSELLSTEGGREHVKRSLDIFNVFKVSSSIKKDPSKSSIITSNVFRPSNSVDTVKTASHGQQYTGHEVPNTSTMSGDAEASNTASDVTSTSPPEWSNPFNYAHQLCQSPFTLNESPVVTNSIMEAAKGSFTAGPTINYYQSIQSFVGGENTRKLKELYPQLTPFFDACSNAACTPCAPFNDVRLFGIETSDFSPISSNLKVDENLLLGVGDVNIRNAMSLQADAKYNKLNMQVLKRLTDKYSELKQGAVKVRDSGQHTRKQVHDVAVGMQSTGVNDMHYHQSMQYQTNGKHGNNRMEPQLAYQRYKSSGSSMPYRSTH